MRCAVQFLICRGPRAGASNSIPHRPATHLGPTWHTCTGMLHSILTSIVIGTGLGWHICVSYPNFVSYSTINDHEISFALDNPNGRSSRCQHDARARCQRQRAPDYFIRSPALRGYVYLLNPILHHARPSPPPHHGSNLQPLCSAFASPSIHPCVSNKRYGRPHCQ